ncbi:MAG: hypothetical protein JKY33_10735, partial [Bacteroidia bacterium]|nr:hypothetical protein [Bacteroidia bacterium]
MIKGYSCAVFDQQQSRQIYFGIGVEFDNDKLTEMVLELTMIKGSWMDGIILEKENGDLEFHILTEENRPA